MTRGEERRPGVGTDAAKGEELAKSLLTMVVADADTGGYTGVDDPRWCAAEILADTWGPALAQSYRLGYGDGRAAGYRAAEQDMQEAWSAVVRQTQRVLRMPTQAELRRRRGTA